MPRHDDPWVSFDVPRDWDNRTIIAYAAPASADGTSTANLVMTRDCLRDDEDLVAYAERHLDTLSGRMKGFSLLDSKDEQVGGRPALTVSFSSKGADEPLIQRLTMVALADRAVVSFTLTAPESQLDQLAPLFERILSSVSFAHGREGP
jgi:hypothetical protein